MNPTMEGIETELNKIFELISEKWVKTSFILSKLVLPINIELKRNQFSLESFIKLYLYKRIKGITTYPDLIKKLDEDDLNNLNIIEIPKKRTFNEFFQKRLTQEYIQFLDNIAENILSTATKHNIILDLEIVKDTITKKKKEVNKKNKAFKEAVKLVKKLVYPQIQIQLRHNAKFTTRDLLDVLVHMAQTHDFCTNGVKTFNELNPDINIPARETILYHLRKLNQKEDIEETFRKIFDVIFEFTSFTNIVPIIFNYHQE